MNLGNVWTLVGSLIAYGFLVFALPALCFGKYVKDKGLVFRFFFYQCIGNLYINFSVMFLGYVNALNVITAYIFIVFIPAFWVCIRERKTLLTLIDRFHTTLYELVAGTYGFRVLCRNVMQGIKARIRYIYGRYIKGNVIEIVIFLGVIAWLVWFYGWYKLHNVGYSHTDEETHLYWVAELMNGNIFPVGMYPHGIHTLVGAISFLTGLTVTRVYLVFCIVADIFIYAAAYMLFRKMFSHVYVALAGWTAMALLGVFNVTAYFRFQSTFPMEFGLVAAFGMIYFMFSFIQTKEKIHIIMFGLCISWSLMAHFYITILCALICVCFALVYGFYIWKKKLLLSFMIAGMAGILLAVLPYGVGFLQGRPFERSIAWALGMAGTTQESDEEKKEEEQEEELTPEELQEKIEEELLKKQLIDDIKEPLPEEIREIYTSFEVYLTENYVTTRSVSATFILIHVAMLIVSVIQIIRKKEKETGMKWLFFTVFWMVGAIVACAYYLNILVLIEVKRMATFLMFFTIPMFAFGVELICRGVRCIKEKHVAKIALATVLLEIIAIVFAGGLKEERFYEITISEGDMLTALDLVENKKNNTWTIVSPTNDLSVVRYDGFHYEIVDLFAEIDGGAKSVYIPTPEIYVVLEEKPISFKVSKREIDRSDVTAPENVKPISPDWALTDIDFDMQIDELHGADAPYYYQREVVMSKLYYWMEAMKDVYASHISEYYRDEQVVVYKIEQDPYFLLNLALDYKTIAKKQTEKN